MTKKELALGKQRHKFALDADKNQRERETQDIGFYEGETQWDSDIKRQRKGASSNGNSPAVPPRPCLTINKVRDPIRKIQNDELQADFGVSIVAADDFSGEIDANEIELREGLARRIQRQSYAQDAVMWGASRAAFCGRGFFGLSTKWVDSDSFDQEVIYERFHDQFSVLGDPSREQPDGSDSEYWFIGRDIPIDIYRDEFPYRADGRKNPLTRDGINDSEWDAYCDKAPSWIKRDGDNRFVRVTKYWRYARERYEIVILDDGSVVPADVLDDETLRAIPSERRRERIVKKVKCAIIDGYEDGGSNALEEYDWPGKFLPIIEIIGEGMHVFDKERRYEGLVRPARDPQKAFNAMISSAVETIALAPKSPWIAPWKSVENFQDQWKEQSTRNWPVMFYNDVDPDTDQPIAAPQRNQAEPPIQAMAMMISTFDQAIMATIGQANLADTHPDVRSGAMASTIIEEAARGTSNYLANLIRSRHYEGQILNDLLYPIYGIRPGRIVSMMNSSQKTERVVIGQPFIPPTQPGAMPQPVQVPTGQQPPENAKTYTLTKDGSFNVAIEVNKFYETKQQEKLALIAGLIEKSPEMFMPVVGDRFMELVGDDDMAKRFGVMLAPPIQAMLKEGQPPDAEKMQMKELLQGLLGEMQQLKADKHARIEQAEIKAMADMATTEKDNETKLEIAQGNNATAIMIAEMTTAIKQQGEQVKLLVQADKAKQEQLRTIEAFMEERRLASDRQHEHDTITRDQAHEIGMARLENKHAHEQLDHEADVFPPSTNGSGE